MNRNWVLHIRRVLCAAVSLTALAASPASAQTEVVMHVKNASSVAGNWQLVADVTAASGARMWNPNRRAAKLNTALATPDDYFGLTFTAEAGRAYRLWLRGNAEGNAWSNDSVHVQFSGSVNAAGAAAYRIGTTASTVVSIEEGGGHGLSDWGWQDNGYDGLGPLVYFATTGAQTIRIQRREDGTSIDQVVLSADTHLTAAPGASKSDTTTLAEAPTLAAVSTSASPTEIVIPVASAATVRGNWTIVGDVTAAGGARLWNPNAGAGKRSSPSASPADYFEVSFNAQAGRAYRLWIRGKAEADYWGNDSVFVQFSGSLNASGSAAYRIGTTSATTVSIEQGDGFGLSNWGWSDNGYDSAGPLVYFATTGPQTLRVQRREDGISLDQIVLSASTFLTTSPGAATRDTTILAGGPVSTTTATEPITTATAPVTTTFTTETAETATATAVTLRVMQWNIGHGRGTDGVYNIDRQAAWMARMNPDVVILNEVEKYTSWGNEDQPARFKAMLEGRTGRTWHAHFSQEYGRWSSNGKGHLILSTYPFDATDHVAITSSSGLGGGGVASQATIVVNGRTINFVLSHLDPYDSGMRLRQARDVINWAAGYAENRILGGDMNAWPDQSSIAEIRKTYSDAWTVAVNKGAATGISGITPFGATKKGRIDYIFFSKNAPNLVVLDSQTPDTRDARGYMPSDHRPLVTTFDVR
jgi:endonuclease/exonuclease/phosphatase family metal-dependent hydrolase